MPYVQVRFKGEWNAYGPGAQPFLAEKQARALEGRGLCDIIEKDVVEKREANKRKRGRPRRSEPVETDALRGTSEPSDDSNG